MGDLPDDSVARVKIGINNSRSLSYLFRLIAERFYGVPWRELQLMRSMTVPDVAKITVRGEPFNPAWYSHVLPGAPEGVLWAFVDPASYFEHRLECQPYDGAHLVFEPAINDWKVTATMAMAPETTLATILKHCSLLEVLKLVDLQVGDYELVDPTGLLHTRRLDELRA